MPTITTKVESARGCGYRKGGGYYFVSDGAAAGCDKLPIELTFCPVCKAGIKQSRGFTWITSELFKKNKCKNESALCTSCIFNEPHTSMGLMWVGAKYYSTAEHFLRESRTMGISKRFSQLPQDFKVGETWIALAHPQGVHVIKKDKIIFKPGSICGLPTKQN
jgi:hypothetical protein